MKAIIDEIRADDTSGAIEVTIKAAEILKKAIRSDSFATAGELADQILKTSKEIYAAKPAMASLANLAAYSLAGAEKATSAEDGISIAIGNIEEFITIMKENVSLVAEHVAAHIEEGSFIITISYSSTVIEAALLAHRQGKKFRFYCLESRPLNEGARLAQVLAGAGIETTLLTDASMFLFMEDMSMALVGGDTISADGLVNKTGTSGLAMAADKFGVPFYALCSSEKLLPTAMNYQPKMDRSNPQQVLKRTRKNLEVINCYFDCTPLERITGVITDKGLIHGDMIMEHLNTLPSRKHMLEILRP